MVSRNAVQGKCYKDSVWIKFDQKETLFQCPTGYYLQGIDRKASSPFYTVQNFVRCELIAADAVVTTTTYPSDQHLLSMCSGDYLLTGFTDLLEAVCKTLPSNLVTCRQIHVCEASDLGTCSEIPNCPPALDVSTAEDDCLKPNCLLCYDIRSVSSSGGIPTGWTSCDSGYYIKKIALIEIDVYTFYNSKVRCCKQRGDLEIVEKC